MYISINKIQYGGLMILNYIVDSASEGKTVKLILKAKLDLSTRLLIKLKQSNKILCNSVPVHVNHIVKTGDKIEVFIEFDEESNDIAPEDIELNILFEDESIIAINKQPGIVVHPTCSHPSETIANGLIKYLYEKNEYIKIRPVSRLDKDTSGIIIFAKNSYIQEALIKQMGNNLFNKEYLAIAHGIFENSSGTIDLPIARKPESIMQRWISDKGYPSVTEYEVIELLNNATYLRLHPLTGRTHQIRVHCQAIGHALLGDFLYLPGSDQSIDSKNIIKRHALHSYKLNFIHPLTKEHLNLTAPIPDDILSALEILRK